MRVLMLSWEYPPYSVGGLARHVEDLAETMVKQNCSVHVLTTGSAELPAKENRNGVLVHRVQAYNLNTPDFLTWVMQLNLAFLERAIEIMSREGLFQIIHAHDWLVAYCGKALKHAYQRPLVATIHATEAGRNQGLHNEQQRYISSVEWWLTYEAWRVIVCSQYMFREVRQLFQLPEDKIVVIPNGVRPEKLQKAFPDPEIQRMVKAEEEIIFFIGRLVREKGVQVLLHAMPAVLAARPKSKLIIAGTGPMQEELRSLSDRLGIRSRVYFAGYVDDIAKNFFYKKARVAVFPSLYEPFGIVALEAMAAGVPVVVADTGGLAEIVTHRENGLKAYPADVSSLASNIIELLRDERLRDEIRRRAGELIRKQYSWDLICRNTVDVYKKVWEEYAGSSWPTSKGSLGKAVGYCRSFLPGKGRGNKREPAVTRTKSLIEQRVLTVNQHPEGRSGL
ncbi:MAG: glycosyltransferase family 4 protein [Clostridia bacterium]|nr:glycosyltransferase family 4 protein [Clostridia bacterium]